MANHESTTAKRRWACCGCLSFATVAVCLFAMAVYLRNNRIPDLAIPIHTASGPNAYDDFMAASRLIRKPSAERRWPPDDMANPPQTREGLLNAAAANTRQAAPGLVLVRRAFSKEYVSPPDRPGQDPTNSTYTVD